MSQRQLGLPMCYCDFFICAYCGVCNEVQIKRELDARDAEEGLIRVQGAPTATIVQVQMGVPVAPASSGPTQMVMGDGQIVTVQSVQPLQVAYVSQPAMVTTGPQ